MDNVSIRPARPADIDTIMALLHKKVEFDNARDRFFATPQSIADGLFGPVPLFGVLLAERGSEAIGFATYFFTYSTYLARPGIWLDDLYVLESHRRAGAGTALLAALANLARERGCGRLEWIVSATNERAIRFYTKHQAQILERARVCRAGREAIEGLARLSD